MKRLSVSSVIFLAWSSSAFAALPSVPFDLDLDGVTVADVVVSMFRDVERVPYVVAPEVYADKRPVSVHLSGAGDVFHSAGISYLSSLGYTVQREHGVYMVGVKPEAKTPEPVKSIWVYRPQYRDAAYLTDQVRALVPGVRFGTDRGVSPAAGGMASTRSAPLAMSASMSTAGLASNSQSTMMTASATPTSALGQLDRSADVLIVNGTAADLALLQSLLPEIDRPEGDLVIHATIFEVATSGHDGSALQLAANLLGGKLGLAFGPATTLSEALTIKTSTVTAVVSALNQDNRFHTLSSPVVQVRSGSESVLNSGQEVPVLGAVSYQGTGGSVPVQSVTYRPSGVLFSVTPIKREKIISVDVHQELSSFVSTTTGVNQTPTLNKRSINTTLSVDPGDIVLLGGLTQDSKVDNEEGLSFLPKFFSAKTGDQQRSEIIMVLQITSGGAVSAPSHLVGGEKATP